jgi:hypothetical protein
MGVCRRRSTQEFKLADLQRLQIGDANAEVVRTFELNPKCFSPLVSQQVRQCLSPHGEVKLGKARLHGQDWIRTCEANCAGVSHHGWADQVTITLCANPQPTAPDARNQLCAQAIEGCPK